MKSFELKEKKDWWAAVSNKSLKDFLFRPTEERALSGIVLVIRSVVSCKGTLVNNDSPSKLAKVIGWLKLRDVISLTITAEV